MNIPELIGDFILGIGEALNNWCETASYGEQFGVAILGAVLFVLCIVLLVAIKERRWPTTLYLPPHSRGYNPPPMPRVKPPRQPRKVPEFPGEIPPPPPPPAPPFPPNMETTELGKQANGPPKCNRCGSYLTGAPIRNLATGKMDILTVCPKCDGMHERTHTGQAPSFSFLEDDS